MEGSIHAFWGLRILENDSGGNEVVKSTRLWSMGSGFEVMVMG